MEGAVTAGENRSAAFVPEIEDEVVAELGFTPYPGTLNLTGVETLDDLPVREIVDPSLGLDNCRGVVFRPCAVGGVRAGIVRPLVEGYPPEKTEVLAPVPLRRVFGLADGDRLQIAPPDDLEVSDGPAVEGTSLSTFDAVVFDLDRTLVELAVPWEEVRSTLEDELRPRSSGEQEVDPDLSLEEKARALGRWDTFLDVVTDYELAGVEGATPLPLLELLASLTCPVGICTRNAEAAARGVIERFDLGGTIDAVVARETVPEQKPDPRPLHRCLSDLGVDAGDAVFVGDDRSDRETAERAGTSFFYPDRICDGY